MSKDQDGGQTISIKIEPGQTAELVAEGVGGVVMGSKNDTTVKYDGSDISIKIRKEAKPTFSMADFSFPNPYFEPAYFKPRPCSLADQCDILRVERDKAEDKRKIAEAKAAELEKKLASAQAATTTAEGWARVFRGERDEYIEAGKADKAKLDAAAARVAELESELATIHPLPKHCVAVPHAQFDSMIQDRIAAKGKIQQLQKENKELHEKVSKVEYNYRSMSEGLRSSLDKRDAAEKQVRELQADMAKIADILSTS